MKRIPLFKGRTAWDVLNFIARIIEQEPKRYNQNDWISLLEERSPWTSPERFPDCGTIGCVAGWTSALISGRKVANKQAGLFFRNEAGQHEFQVAVRARQILGLTKLQADELFESDALRTVARLLDPRTFTFPDKGTDAYAALGVFHIYRFMHKHEQQLRRKRVSRSR